MEKPALQGETKGWGNGSARASGEMIGGAAPQCNMNQLLCGSLCLSLENKGESLALAGLAQWIERGPGD